MLWRPPVLVLSDGRDKMVLLELELIITRVIQNPMPMPRVGVSKSKSGPSPWGVVA